jgi:F-type H+-transporting ATPase subunit b
MIELNWTFFAQFANFVIILAILNLVLYRPIRGMIRKRAEIMGEKLHSIQEFTAEAENKLENYKAALSGARSEAQQIRLSLKEEGSAAEASVLSAAGAEAAEKITAAKKDVEEQKQAALKSLRGTVNAYAKEVAGKVLSRT